MFELSPLLADASSGLLEILTGPNARFISIVATVGLVLSVWAASAAWRAARESEHRTRLTAALLERGLRADDIERVLRATYGATPCPAPAAAEPASGDPEVRIVKHMSDCSYEPGDIEKVLAAARENEPIDEGTVKMIEVMSTNWAEAAEIADLIRNRRTREARRGAGHPGGGPTQGAVARVA
jgi:hypothetical protein